MEHLEFGENFEYILPAIKLKVELKFGNAFKQLFEYVI